MPIDSELREMGLTEHGELVGVGQFAALYTSFGLFGMMNERLGY